jgi:hypothetical protein
MGTLRSADHVVRPKYTQHYLAEFQYRFDRRANLCAMSLEKESHKWLIKQANFSGDEDDLP